MCSGLLGIATIGGDNRRLGKIDAVLVHLHIDEPRTGCPNPLVDAHDVHELAFTLYQGAGSIDLGAPSVQR